MRFLIYEGRRDDDNTKLLDLHFFYFFALVRIFGDPRASQTKTAHNHLICLLLIVLPLRHIFSDPRAIESLDLHTFDRFTLRAYFWRSDGVSDKDST
jgi:hypothetical protein